MDIESIKGLKYIKNSLTQLLNSEYDLKSFKQSKSLNLIQDLIN